MCCYSFINIFFMHGPIKTELEVIGERMKN